MFLLLATQEFTIPGSFIELNIEEKLPIQVQDKLDVLISKYDTFDILAVHVSVVQGLLYKIEADIEGEIGQILMWHKLDNNVEYISTKWLNE
ncbi:hypothetical protein SS50377_27515 [Spironucleus salmonicida]|uniref:Uncharacterized protein n=1 Tax=Spironucleus salmonicida TaxID=348837 RepID=V6LQE6_9EUKA|nr:hypothetical protein SS50377_27515 [Spironucleus salmonicida]|eukprot:EST46892.1 Hypothetical protein SS50377_13045 [Spironucleus salmonicida]